MNIKQVPAHRNNYGDKRKYPVKRIVMHWIVGELSAADATFKNPSRKASAHFGVGSNGEIHQYVPEDMVAWHAGPKVNFESIGIEHAGGQLINGTRKVPTQQCLDASAELVADLCKRYNLPCNRDSIKLHKEYMSTTCPGMLNVDYIISKANQIMGTGSSKYELYKKGADVWLKIGNTSHDGIAFITRRNTGDPAREGTVFEAYIDARTNKADRKIIVNADPITYEVSWAFEIKTIDLRPATPPPTDPEKEQLEKDLAVEKTKNAELINKLTQINSLSKL